MFPDSGNTGDLGDGRAGVYRCQQQYSATRLVILPITVTIIQSTWNRSWMNGRNGDFPRMESIQDFWLTRSRQIRSWIFSEGSGKRRPWYWWIRLWEIMAVLMEFIQKACGERMVQLVRSAQVITPNLTEALLLLYGKEEMEKRYTGLLELDGEKRLEQIEKIGEKLANEYCLQAAVITGVESKRNVLAVLQEVSVISTQKLSRTSEQTENLAGKPNSKETSLPQMGNLVVENGHLSWCFAPKIGGSYSGTGDLFASVLSAGSGEERCP